MAMPLIRLQPAVVDVADQRCTQSATEHNAVGIVTGLDETAHQCSDHGTHRVVRGVYLRQTGCSAGRMTATQILHLTSSREVAAAVVVVLVAVATGRGGGDQHTVRVEVRPGDPVIL